MDRTAVVLYIRQNSGAAFPVRRRKRGSFVKDKTRNTPQVLVRRAVLVLLDAAIVAFSF